MALLQLNELTQAQIAARGVQALADRPNANGQYGQSDMSATQLKLWFDKLATYLAENINSIREAFSSNDAAEYIKAVITGNENIVTLGDLIRALSSGDMAADILKVKANATASEYEPLQAAINRMAENISNIIANSGASITQSVSGNTLTLSLKNEEGTVVSTADIDLAIGTLRINDGAVTTDKIAQSAVTAAKVADNAIETAKIKDENVTAAKLAAESVENAKIKNGSVTVGKLADNAVETLKIKDGNVTTPKIADNAITQEKLSNTVASKLNGAYKDISFDSATGVLTFTCNDGTTETIDLPLEYIVTGGSYDGSVPGSEKIILTLANGSGNIEIPVSSLLSGLIDYMDGIRESMFDVQEAPPLASLASALLLPTPTLAQIAALQT